MSLRTYPLIIHPAFLAFVERELHGSSAEEADLSDTLFIPRIEKISEITEYLKISHFTVRSLLTNIPKYYRSFEITKRNGGKRTIDAPRTFLKVIQWWIYDAILIKYSLSDEVHGFRQGRSFITNAKVHLGARHILNVDIENFFGSIQQSSVEQVFQRFGYSATVCSQLSMLCTFYGRLPQGAPTSPAIANIILNEFDRAISERCNSMDIIYSRYADDLTFSSQNRIEPEFVPELSRDLAKYGFKLNASKTKFMGPNSKQEVTGLVLGFKSVNLSIKSRNAARAWFHALRNSRDTSWEVVERLRGTVALIRSVGGAGSERLIASGLATIRMLEARLGP